jgi:GH15 family glucan-1,4-alpha-glucosidase
MKQRPSIGDYGAIGDGRSVALVSRWGAVDWLCWPRIDSGSIFGALLDPEGGTFELAPLDDLTPQQAYLPGTNVLQTTWTGKGRLEVTDFMPALTEAQKRAFDWPDHALVRIARCLEGPIRLRVRLDARPGYGERVVVAHRRWPQVLCFDPGKGLLALCASRALPAPVEGQPEGPLELRLEPGEELALVLVFSVQAPAVFPEPSSFAKATLEATTRFWREWADRARYEGPWREQVVRSALATRLLHFAPSGAIVAAATTSLPERPGGDLNWDYRYAWVRDSALTVRALLALGYEEEAQAFVSWMLHASNLSRPQIGVLYDVYGRQPGGERELSRWRGFAGSAPVRVGNAAAGQVQLDTYGEVIDAVTQLCRAGQRLDAATAGMLRDFGEYVCRNWERKDQGIWEPRGDGSHFTHSKALCWVALDRLLELHAHQRFRRFPEELFEKNRAMIRDAVEARGWSDGLQSYVQVFDGDTVDASALLLGWYGYRDPHDDRIKATGRAVQKRLGAGPGLLYRNEQSREVGEGAFVICSFWMVELLARSGQVDEARAWFDQAVQYASPTGLLAEEVATGIGAALGNYPQAFSHLGLIGAALSLDRAEKERRSSRRSG